MFSRTTLFLTTLALLAAGLAACGRKVTYGDPQAVETVTIDFGSTDLQVIAERMIDSLLTSPLLAREPKPVLYVAAVQNKTDEHVDTKNITDKVRTKLVQSQRFVITDRGPAVGEIRAEMDFQRESGMVDPKAVVETGKGVAPQYFLYGELTSIRKKAGRVEDVYFKFTFNLMNLEKNTLDWAEEKEIRKGAKKRFFGL